MGLKRKRSINESPRSVSSFGGFASTPEAQSPTPMSNDYDAAMDMEVMPQLTPTNRGMWSLESAPRVKESDWVTRTRKRFRDNRPDERVIHENTINKLFAAQRTHPHAEPIPSDTLPSHQTAPVVQKPQKSTLHSFWKQLPAPPVQAPTLRVQHQHEAPQSWTLPLCDDCDSPLRNEADYMDVDVDVNVGAVGNRFACNDCGRSVCGICAVVSSTRHCLQCATSGRNSRRWW